MKTVIVPQFELLKYFPLVKVDESTHTVYGLATCEETDKEGEICDYDGAKKAYQEWSKEAQDSTTAAGQGISLGNIRYMHRLIMAGKATKINFDDARKQIWLESTPAPPMSTEDPDVWPLLRDGFLRGYSQGGKYVSRVCNDCRKDISGNFCQHCNKRVDVRYIPTISEVWWVDNPCLKQATFVLVKSDGSTELKKFAGAALPTAVGYIPSEIQQPVIVDVSPAVCSCSCEACTSMNCASCSADPKCSHEKAAKIINFNRSILEERPRIREVYSLGFGK